MTGSRPATQWRAKVWALLTPAFKEFLLHGARDAFPPARGALVAGVPTAYATPPQHVHLAPSAPAAALRSTPLHENLALFDALRIGNARERELAQQLFVKRL